MRAPRRALPNRPHCAYCAKLYGKPITRMEMTFCPDDPEHPDVPPTAPPYNGNGIVVQEWYNVDEESWRSGDRSVESKPQGTVNPSLIQAINERNNERDTISISRMLGDPDARRGRTLYRTVGLPEDYSTPYAPFCTLRCGLKFAQSSHRAGYRIKKT